MYGTRVQTSHSCCVPCLQATHLSYRIELEFVELGRSVSQGVQVYAHRTQLAFDFLDQIVQIFMLYIVSHQCVEMLQHAVRPHQMLVIRP